MIAGQQRTRLAEEPAEMVHRVPGYGAGEVGAANDLVSFAAVPTAEIAVRSLLEFLPKILCNEEIPRTPTLLSQHVVDVRIVSDRAVDRDRPWRGRPDHGVRADQLGDRALDDL